MSNNELIATVTELQEYKRIMDEAKTMVEALTAKVKEHMADIETLIAGPYKLTCKTYTASKLDAKAMVAAHPELAGITAEYTTVSTSRRLMVH